MNAGDGLGATGGRAAMVLSGATIVFLFVAPFAGSAGLRGLTLLVALGALLVLHRGWPDFTHAPRAILLAFLAWAAIAAASFLWSVHPGYTLGELRSEVLYAAGVLAVFFLAAAEPSHWPRWRAALLAGSLAVAVLHVAQDLLPFALTRHATVGQGGLWSTHLVLIAPLVFTLGAPAPWGVGARPVLQAVALLLLFGAAWETGNRAVWVALAAQLVIAFALARLVSADGRLRAFRGMALVATVLVALSLVFSVKDRMASASPGAPLASGIANDVRPQIWSFAWARFLEAPVLGHGFGREILADAFENAATPLLAGHPPVRHSHNLFMDMALQLGIAGLAAFVALLGLLGARYASFLRDPQLAALGVTGLALLAGFVLKNLTDDFFHRHNALVFWALNGMLLGLGSARAPEAAR